MASWTVDNVVVQVKEFRNKLALYLHSPNALFREAKILTFFQK